MKKNKKVNRKKTNVIFLKQGKDGKFYGKTL